jgi:selenocysteine-specific elongation factor
VRGLQTRHLDLAAIDPGQRAAVNLSGVDRTALTRGDVLVRPGQWHLTTRVDARLDVLATLDHPVSRRGAHVAHLGAGEFAVRLRVLGDDALAPGTTGLVRLHLPVALPLLPGDRFVLREWGRDETVGGGAVLDVDPVLPASTARPDGSTDRLVAERGWVDITRLERLTGERRAPDVGTWAVAPAALAEARETVRAAIDAAGTQGLEVTTLDDRHQAVLATLDGVEVVAGRARPAGGAATAASGLVDHPWLAELRAAPFTPPGPEGVDPTDVRALVDLGLVVRVDKVWFSADAVERAAEVVAGLLVDAPDGVTVGDVREALGSTRKYVVPLLGHLDATGRTRRRGDARIAGPRL